LLIAAAALTTSPFAWSQSLPGAPPERVGMSAQRLQKLAEVFKQEVDSRAP